MRQAGRKRWNSEDYNAAVKAFNELCPPTDVEAGYNRSRLQVKPGRPFSASRPTLEELHRLYVRERRSIRDVAEAIGCTRDMVHRALREHGIQARPVARRSMLQDVPLDKLEAEIAAQGLRGAARAFGVDHSTLAQHVKARRSAG